MNDRVDALLNKLKAAPSDHGLDRLESAVWAKLDHQKRADIFGGKTLQVQLAVSCAALLLGLLIAQFTGISVMPMPLSSEMVVLSDDSAMAPSVLLEGGT